MLLRRYGVLFRELMEREQVGPRWRDLLAMLRRMEARGEVRGGRFVTGVSGEQYALPEAMVSLRESKKRAGRGETVEVAAADPVNLAGILCPGERVSAMPGRVVAFAVACWRGRDGGCSSANRSSPDGRGRAEAALRLDSGHQKLTKRS
jgi:ATP-dependent Lhr-like helicase